MNTETHSTKEAKLPPSFTLIKRSILAITSCINEIDTLIEEDKLPTAQDKAEDMMHHLHFITYLREDLRLFEHTIPMVDMQTLMSDLHFINNIVGDINGTLTKLGYGGPRMDRW